MPSEEISISFGSLPPEKIMNTTPALLFRVKSNVIERSRSMNHAEIGNCIRNDAPMESEILATATCDSDFEKDFEGLEDQYLSTHELDRIHNEVANANTSGSPRSLVSSPPALIPFSPDQMVPITISHSPPPHGYPIYPSMDANGNYFVSYNNKLKTLSQL